MPGGADAYRAWYLGQQGGGGTSTGGGSISSGISPATTLAGLFAGTRLPGRAGGGAAGTATAAVSAAEAPTNGYVRPEPVERPGYLGFMLGMSPLQERTAIASGAISGQNTAFGGSDVAGYYRNLALRELLTPAGTIIEQGQVLPIERDYVTKVLGQQPADMSLKSFVDALMRK